MTGSSSSQVEHLDQVSKPALSYDILVEMSSKGMLKDAQKLLDAGAVEECTWEAPVLKGRVSMGGQTFFPKVNLRSTIFVKNDCSCVQGRKGQVCEHAMALCLQFMDAPQELLEEAEDADGSSDETLVVRYLTLSEAKGKRLYFRVVLPPNLAQTAPRNAMVVKVEGRIKGKEIPLEKLDKGRAYKLDAANYRVAALLEEWCDRRLLSIIQLNRERLRKLLDALKGKPAVYWAHQPDRAIEWTEEGTLPGVHSFLEEPEEEEELDQYADDDDDAMPVAVSPTDVVPMHVDGSSNFLSIRLPSKESAVYGPAHELLKTYGFVLEPANRRWWLRDRRKTLNFLAEYWVQLKEQWGAVFSNNFKRKTVRIKFAKIIGQGREEGERFILTMELKAGQAGEQGIRDALASGQYFVESGKKVVLLDPEVVEHFTEAQRALSGDATRPCTPVYRSSVTTAQFADVESILESAGAHFEAPKAWRQKSAALKNVSKLKPAPIFKELDERLRMYQRIGVAWLWHLYKNDLGGILADEMGLGKTVQALALLACIRDEAPAHEPCLVVCPAGLIENWRREARTFAPGLKVFINHRDSRLASADTFADYDLIITSYSTLSQDVEMFSSIRFASVIADEAQHVKNRQTRNAKALRSLRAKGRFLLTGTPLENCLDDLRSLFEFLMPGYLQPAPSSMRQEERDWYNRRLRDQAAPYILRRSKELVAPELPKKLEQTIYCAMEPKQSDLYKAYQEETQKEISQLELAGVSEGKIRMAAFNQLLRLRQICSEPRLLDDKLEAADSAKLQAFKEILEESVDGGDRMLVFSQFVSVLTYLREYLDKEGIPYCYLDGKTRNRLAVCDSFNKDANIPVFLISLKAGGTGLNLTGANRVIHYDPWWNPAVEAQATDRAHRIGQTRTVTSIKLIAADSVEEKVLELQRTKMHLLKDLLEASEAANSSISLDDLKALLEIKGGESPEKPPTKAPKARASKPRTVKKVKKEKNSVDE